MKGRVDQHKVIFLFVDFVMKTLKLDEVTTVIYIYIIIHGIVKSMVHFLGDRTRELFTVTFATSP